MFYNVNENRKLKDPFLAKDVCRFCHDASFELQGQKKIYKEGTRLGRKETVGFREKIEEIILKDFNYLLVDWYFQNLGNRGMPNDVYLFTYDDMNELIYNHADGDFLGLFHIVPIHKNNIESFIEAKWVLQVLEEGSFYLYNVN